MISDSLKISLVWDCLFSYELIGTFWNLLCNDYIKSPFYFCKIKLSVVSNLFVEMTLLFQMESYVEHSYKSDKNKRMREGCNGSLEGHQLSSSMGWERRLQALYGTLTQDHLSGCARNSINQWLGWVCVGYLIAMKTSCSQQGETNNKYLSLGTSGVEIRTF